MRQIKLFEQPNPSTLSAPDTNPDIEWVFGYGSLMWRPGFEFLEQSTARLNNYHRAPCIYSHHHRGTSTVPGLVLGLDNGGYCDGIAFRININIRTEVIEYLHERELIGYAYRPIILDIDIGNSTVSAYTFVADPTHGQYAGDLGLDQSAEVIMKAQGVSGLNRDYLMSTVQKLESEGFAEPALLKLRQRVRELTGAIDQGGGI